MAHVARQIRNVRAALVIALGSSMTRLELKERAILVKFFSSCKIPVVKMTKRVRSLAYVNTSFTTVRKYLTT